MSRHSFSMTNPARGVLKWGAVGAMASLALLGLPGGAALAAAANTVSLATIQLDSLSASATDVTYTVTFKSAHALTQGTSTITLAAPSGTALPSGTCYSVADDATGAAGCDDPTPAGTSAVITMPVNVAAGDPVSVRVPDVGNPTSAGAKTLKVSTSADPTTVSLHYTLVAKRSVGDASLAVSSSSASATGVTYSVTFASTDRLSRTSQVSIAFPSGTKLPAGGCSQVDWFNGTNGSSGCVAMAAAGTTATVTGLQSNAGDMNTITFYGVTSPGSTGTHNVKLSTTSDPKQVTLTYSLVAKRSITDPFLQLSSYTPSATGVTWAVGFVAPDRLVDSGVDETSTSVIISAPAGTKFPVGGCGTYVFIDAGPAGSQGPENGCSSGTVTDNGAKVSVTAGFDTNPGNTIFVVINGVKNPASMTSVKVSTSADPATVQLGLSGPTAMAATDQLTSTSASATGVTYAETFASTGALTSGTSTLTLTSPGATFATVCPGEYAVIDDTTGADSGACPVSGSSPGSSMTLADQLTSSAGDEITVLAYGVANATASGGGTFAVTTSGAGGVSLPIHLTAKTSVSSPVLSLASTSASATDVAYSATFTVANGLMVNGLGDDFSTIALSAAAGTKFPASGSALVFNDATGTEAASSYTGSGATATVLPGSGGDLGAGPGDEISVIVFGATNPSSSGPRTASVSTTSDPKALSAGYPLTAATAVAKDILQLSSLTGGASGVTYSFTFQAANGLVTSGYSDSTITVTLPTGTGMPPNGSGDVNVLDNTTGTDCGGFATSTGTTATVQLSTGSCPGELAAGDVVTLTLAGVTNAPSLTGTSAELSTSSDPATVTTALP
jgi:hypothetical protein